MLLATVDTYSDQTASKHGIMKQPKAHEREVCFILMQMITALKHLQSQVATNFRSLSYFISYFISG